MSFYQKDYIERLAFITNPDEKIVILPFVYSFAAFPLDLLSLAQGRP